MRDERAPVLDENAGQKQPFEHALDQRLGVGFGPVFVEMGRKEGDLAADGVERHLAHQPPQSRQLDIAVLEGQRGGACVRQRFGVGLAGGVARGVEPSKVFERQIGWDRSHAERYRLRLHPDDELADLEPPIAVVDVGNHVMANGREYAPQAFSDHERPQMSDMELLRDVRASTVDYDLFLPGRRPDAEIGRAPRCGRTRTDVAIVEREVEKSGSGHRDRRDPVKA
jgi:hypothetical protein